MVQGSNDYYGATELDVNNVVFVHGSIDPWHAMGRLTDLNENSPAIIIPGKLTYRVSRKILVYVFIGQSKPNQLNEVIVPMILGTSHCVDMYANEPGDPKELVDARARIGELVGKWINEAN